MMDSLNQLQASSLLLAGVLLGVPHQLVSQNQPIVTQNQYTITQITSGSPDHVSPAVNTKGDIVWTQVVNGFSQVYVVPSGQSSCSFSSGSIPTLLPGQQNNHNNQFPVIDDDCDVVYLKDGVGSGPGLAVVENSGGAESTIEFSSGNRLDGQTCTEPPAGPSTCDSFRRAGQHFGISRDGTIISYFDFCSAGTCTRHFGANGVALSCSMPTCFGTDDYPDIDNNGDFIFTVSGQIQESVPTIPNPTVSLVAAGSFGRINNGGDVVVVSGGQVKVFLGLDFVNVLPVSAGSWASINDNGLVVFQNSDSSGQQIFTASLCGEPSKDNLKLQYLRNEFPPQTGIVDIVPLPNRRFVPQCADITKSASTADYSFPALNTSNRSDPGAALVANSLLNGLGVFCATTASPTCGLNAEVAAFGSAPNMKSGFRPPLDQIRVYREMNPPQPPKPSGRHMFGDAVDLAVIPAGNATQWNALLNAAINSGADFTESTPSSNGLQCSRTVMACVHADWRTATSLRGGTTPYAH